MGIRSLRSDADGCFVSESQRKAIKRRKTPDDAVRIFVLLFPMHSFTLGPDLRDRQDNSGLVGLS